MILSRAEKRMNLNRREALLCRSLRLHFGPLPAIMMRQCCAFQFLSLQAIHFWHKIRGRQRCSMNSQKNNGAAFAFPRVIWLMERATLTRDLPLTLYLEIKIEAEQNNGTK